MAFHRLVALTLLASLAAVPSASAQKVLPPFDASYHLFDLGPAPGVPVFYGGLAFKAGRTDTLLIGGTSNGDPASLWAVGVVRGAGNHITGFSGDATVFADAPFNDGGLAYGPDGVLFVSRFHIDPMPEFGETKAASTTVDKVVDLSSLGVVNAPGGLNFVPTGFPGAGGMKYVSFNDGKWYTITLAADGSGTFDATAASAGPTLFNGPEGFFYVPAGLPGFPNPDSVLAAEFFAAGFIVTYQVDPNGDPKTDTRTVFVDSLHGAQGAVVDPLTGDFLFSTFGDLNHVVNVHTYAPLPCASDADCDDGNVCTDETCDTGTGKCTYTDHDAIPCDDGLFCNGTDTCSGGTCSLHTGDPCAGTGPECQNFCFEGTDSCGNAPNGIGCTDDGDLCTHDTCDGNGSCTHPSFVQTNCLDTAGAKASLLVKDNTDNTKDVLVFKMSSTGTDVLADFGNPVTTDDYQLCVFDDVSGTPTLKLAARAPHDGACGTKPCWKASTTGFSYKSKDGTPEGSTGITLKLGKTGNPTIVVKGKGEHLATPPIPLTLGVTAQVKSANGQCWNATFGTATKNAAGTFSAKLP